MAKVVELCIGKFIKGSGTKDVLVETNLFGIKAVESVINDCCYNRSLRGFLIIEDALELMIWKTFWATTGKTVEHHKRALETLATLFVQKDWITFNQNY